MLRIILVNVHLCLIEMEDGGDFNSPGPGQVFVEMKFLLQFSQLFRREVCPPVAYLSSETVLGHLRVGIIG